MAPHDPPATPLWLTDTSYPAPCPCGKELYNGEPIAMVIGESGLATMMHATCFQQTMGSHDIQGDDEL